MNNPFLEEDSTSIVGVKQDIRYFVRTGGSVIWREVDSSTCLRMIDYTDTESEVVDYSLEGTIEYCKFRELPY